VKRPFPGTALAAGPSRVTIRRKALAVAGATSPAFTQSTDRSPNMPDNIRFSNPDTMQKAAGL
jgi:hypothetical protein